MSLPPLHHRKWMKDQLWECWLHRCEHRRERQVQPHPRSITPTENMLSHVHLTVLPVQGDLWRCAHTRESQVEVQMFCKSLIPREKGSLLSIESSSIFLNCKQIIRPNKEKRQLSQNSLTRNIIRDCFLKNRRIICCLKHDPR